nr:hypothetical protein [Micromonospora provocatoris]
MTAFEELTREFDDASIASEIIESLLDNGYEIREGSVEALGRGYTGARLAKALLDEGSYPSWCVIKYCPPGPTNHRREPRQHLQAWEDAPKSFRKKHLTEIAFPPVRLRNGAVVIGQSKADGVPLGSVEPGQLATVCRVVWSEILGRWAGKDYDSEHSTVADLLLLELGDSFLPGGWLYEWARGRGLLAPAFLELPDEVAPLPNPWRLFADKPPAMHGQIHYVVGRSHGDLHGGNILLPTRNGVLRPAKFRLIDLATYNRRAPLSRDLAALLVSLSWQQVGASSARIREALLTYLERDHGDPDLRGIVPSEVRKIIDALRDPTLQFLLDKGWDECHWHRQLKVSLLAQAMLHSAYDSGTADARRWCARLASRLARLLNPVEPSVGPSVPFDAGKVNSSATAPVKRPAGHVARSTPTFVDRIDQRSRLRTALEDQVSSVIVVYGPVGIGKTALVREVLADLGRADPDDESAAVRWYEVTPYGEVGVPTLIEAIEPPGSDRVAGPSARARLEIAMDRIDAAAAEANGLRPVVVFDLAENLLDGDHVLRDSELDLALEAVQSRLRPVVKVVLITQVVPQAKAGVAWTRTASRITVDGLDPESLREHFTELDPGNRYGLAGLPDSDLRQVHGHLAGNPRLAELLHAVLSSDPPGLQTEEVAPWLLARQANEVHAGLVQLLLGKLPIDQLRVAQALAALGVPAHTDSVISVLEPYLARDRVQSALEALVKARFVLERSDGRRYLRKPESGAVLESLADSDRDSAWDGDERPSLTRRRLLLRAASVLQAWQKGDEDVQGIADMEMHFARIDVWLRAGLYEQAHSLIESMNELVHVWGSGAELRAQREAVRDRLGDDREGEMMNLAALGDIYSYSGEFLRAQASYRAALAIATQGMYREAERRILIGMGSMFWEHAHVFEAEQHYRRALDLEGEYGDDPGDRAAALIGIADCQQRHGLYGQAVTNALSAFEGVHDIDPGQAIDAALRLTRWYAEVGQIMDALTMLSRCEDLVSTYPDPSARADLLNATANLELYRRSYDSGQAIAARAVAHARDHRDAINLGRSLTTLALAYVHLDELAAARDAIEESARYRVAGQDTIELALRGIIAHRCQLPATARDLFRQLHGETSRRTGADRNDLAAWDFTGIARSYEVLLGRATPVSALEAFRQARPQSAAPTPGLDDRLRFMVEILAGEETALDSVLIGLAHIRPGCGD